MLHMVCSTLIRESWKKIQNAGPSPSAFSGKKSRAQCCCILYMSRDVKIKIKSYCKRRKGMKLRGHNKWKSMSYDNLPHHLYN